MVLAYAMIHISVPKSNNAVMAARYSYFVPYYIYRACYKL